MTDIDLTPMNEAVARELYAHVIAENAIKSMNTPQEEQAATRIQWKENMRVHWDEMPATDDTRLYWRELALAATLTTWKAVARQAWAEGYTAGGNDNASYLQAINGIKDHHASTVNPYLEDA